MKRDGLLSLRGLASAALLLCAALLLAWQCGKAALARAIPGSPDLARVLPHNPDVVLGIAVDALVKQRGILSPAMLAAVRRAAQAEPLDARPFLILGHQQLLDRQPLRAEKTLEAGQRLDPRQRIIHLLLVDRYLRTGRYTDAATQFALSARLMGAVQEPIAIAMARMSIDPQMRDAVRRALQTDPALERSVLVALAKSNTPPSAIFALASPAARRDAGRDQSWGPVLVDRLIAQSQYADARSVWQSIYALSAAQLTTPVFDSGFRGLAGSPPFNWLLVANSMGAADIRDGMLSVDYYGRDNGDLTSQLLVLRPGPYRFAITVEGSKTGAGPSLAWSLHCATGSKAEVMTLQITATGMPHRVATLFTVPTGCVAQQLTLSGIAGDFPAPITVTLRDLDLRAMGAVR